MKMKIKILLIHIWNWLSGQDGLFGITEKGQQRLNAATRE